MQRLLTQWCIFIVAILAVVSCSGTGAEKQSQISNLSARTNNNKSEKPIILVSIAPQKYFVEQVAGTDTFEIAVIVPEGQSPHSYEPTPSQLVRMSKAVLWFTIGVEFEAVLIPKLTAIAPSLKLIDTTQGILYRELESHSDRDHDEAVGIEKNSQQTETHHVETGKDPHVWLGLSNAVIQTSTICQALSDLMPDMQDVFRRNQAQFASRIQALKAELAAKTQVLQKKSVFVYHPAFGYLLDEIGLTQMPIEVSGKEPGTQQLTAIINAMKQEGARVIFVQKQFSSLSAQKIAEAIRGQVIELDPLAYDWEKNIRIIYNTLISVQQSSGKQ